MLHNPQESRLFPKLSPEAVLLLQKQGEEHLLNSGDILFREGDPIEHFFVILAGSVRITKIIGGQEQLLTIHEVGEFTGDITMLTHSPASSTGHAHTPSRVLKVAASVLGHLVIAHASLAALILTAMAGRTQEVGSHLQQQEKLASLGKLSAGLAHELNNPAAAGRRAAKQLRALMETVQLSTLNLGNCQLSAAQRQFLVDFHTSLVSTLHSVRLDPMAQSDREDALGDWLADHQISEGWKLAPTLVNAGIEETQLQGLSDQLGVDCLPLVLNWLQSSLDVVDLIAQVEHTTERISELVNALKSYSYMDQAPLQEIDLHDGIDNTLTMLHHKLKQGITVVKDYGNLPKICAFGSELNQVWTNMIDNAIDAMQNQGTLTIRTRDFLERVQVEISDTGSGIPADIQPKIFEPFFTTKGIGQGTGLGLDIVRRIIYNRHGGSIRVESQPGDTRFLLTLPLSPPKDKG